MSGRWRLLILLAFCTVTATGAIISPFADRNPKRAGPRVEHNRGGVTSSRAPSIRVEAAIARSDWTTTISLLRQVLRAQPGDVAANRDLVWALERSGRDQEAAAVLTARPWLYRSSSAPKQTSMADAPEPPALVAARAAVQRRPRDAGRHAALAEALVSHARAQTAATTSRCITCHHREPPLYGPAVTRLLFPDRDTLLQALAARQSAARLRPSRADALRMGQIYFSLATLYPPRHREAKLFLSQAAEWLERSVRQMPRSADAWSSLALARLKQDNRVGAEVAWRRTLALSAKHEEARINLANLLQSREPAAALALYTEGLRLLPNSAALRTNYGVLLWQMGHYPEAVAAQREALRRQPGEPVALLNLGLALKAAGDLEAAEAVLRESIRRRPGGAIAHNALGSLLAQRGDWEGAARAFAAASRHNPGLAAAHANLGRAYERLGRQTEAVEAYRRAIICEPERRQLRERITALKGKPPAPENDHSDG